jgi:hypothetical protein
LSRTGALTGWILMLQLTSDYRRETCEGCDVDMGRKAALYPKDLRM